VSTRQSFLIVSERPAIATGWQTWLEADLGARVAAVGYAEAVAEASRRAPDWVLLDLADNPRAREALQVELQAAGFPVTVAVASPRIDVLMSALNRGASGFILDRTDRQSFVDGHRPGVTQVRQRLDPGLQALALDYVVETARQPRAGGYRPLTQAQLTLLRLVAAGRTNQQIALQTACSAATVKRRL
jgi:DNA-binding NarL/FixJ family response regulator